MSNIESTKYLRDYRRDIVKHFSMEEIETLAFDLSIDWDELPGNAKSSKAQALLAYLARRKRLSDLLTLLREERPKIDWPDIKPDSKDQAKDGESLVFENTQDMALNNYFEKMSLLVLSKRKTGLVKAAQFPDQPDDEYELYDQGARAIALALTSVVLNLVNDNQRIELVEVFLKEAGLYRIWEKVTYEHRNGW
jgi:hypothetical protein